MAASPIYDIGGFFTDFNESRRLVDRSVRQGSFLGLERVNALLELLGSPHKNMRFVHIAGTNGKGSIAAMVSGALCKAGLRTGLYTSPALNSFNERMTINGRMITDGETIRLAERAAAAVSQSERDGSDKPSEFEFVTVMAFLWFFESGCDVVVLETGLGGRLDATNVIDRPEAAVIAAIGLDHTAELGGTLALIAGEKAAIIKPGCDAVSYAQEREAQSVIERRAAETGARLTVPDFSKIRPVSQDLDGQHFDYGGERGLFIPLLGPHQLKNAAVAIETIYRLRERGFAISDAALRDGLKTAVWPGRFEVLRRKPPVILDGAHNAQGVRALAGALAGQFPGQKIIFVPGILADKDYEDMLSVTAPQALCYITAAPPSPRALPAGELAEAARGCCGDVTAAPDPETACNLALERQRREGGRYPVCFFGSLYMAGGIREYFLKKE